MPDVDDIQPDSEGNSPSPECRAAATHCGRADEPHVKFVLDAVRDGDVTPLMRHLGETRDPITIAVAALLDPDPNAPATQKLELKRRRRGRPTRSAQNAIAAKVLAAAATGVKVESQFADLKAKGVSRSSANRYRKLLGLNEKK